ncbi:hypothetical protein LSAT2_019613 [Lamellibrachia satsuma]|nr:hypothetical protein LSAT2_019613 [Lamellibrachia satsuma]
MTTEGGGGDAGDVIVMNGDVPEMACDVTDEGKVSDEDTDGSTVNSAPSLDSNVCYDVREIVARSVAADVEHRVKSTPNFQVRLMMARKHLMGMSTNMRRKSLTQPKG